MRKIIMYLVIYTILCLSAQQGINYSLGNQIQNRSPFYLSFSSIGANLLESRLDCWAKIKVTSTSQELDENLIHILQHLQLSVQRNKFIHDQNDEINELRYSCEQNNKNYIFTLRSDQRNNETICVITIVSTQEWPDIKKTADQLKQIMDFKYYYLYSGTIKNLYNYGSQEKMLNNIMKQLDAKTIEVYKNEKVTSMTGYSNELKKWVEPVNGGDKRYNVQAAIRSNSQNGTTQVYLGSPLILGDY